MASWKLCTFLLASVLFVLVTESEGRRRRGPRQPETGLGNAQGEQGGEEDQSNNGGRPWRRRGGGGGGGRRRGGGGGGGRRRGGGGRGGGRRGGGGGGGGNPGRRGQRMPNGRRLAACLLGGRRLGCPTGQDGDLMEQHRANILHSLSTSVDTFSLDMYQEMASRSQDNFVFSPFGVYSAMTMVKLGASGRTNRQLAARLHMSRGVHQAMGLYLSSLPQEGDGNSTLSLANAIFVRPGFTYNPAYANRLRMFYNTTGQEIEAVDPEDSINAWVESETQGEISEFLEPGSIDASTVIMLVNAIYFRGLWQTPFDADYTSPTTFHVSDSETAIVDMMSHTGRYTIRRSAVLGADVLELPYAGDRFVMYLLRPAPGTALDLVISRLSPQTWNETINGDVSTSRCTVKVPKFALDTSQSMKEILQSLGITRAFDPAAAKFRTMTRARDVYINEVEHRSVIELDEEGTVAAAATGVQIATLSLPPEFILDRPFMFLLRDKVQGINLFAGRYANPNGENLAM
ncbi:serpin B6 [Aplysia californica]|uniref:Serpin B6 n=1 Tax=Aplysia californica TaxID=6500 RepID=A0ABM0JLC9_APLCA|nr:serpin B6 [Aplysia californica]